MGNAARLAVLAIILSLSVVQAADWPGFRGPSGTGVASGSDRYPTTFGPDKKVHWKVDLPAGISSPCVVGGRIVLTGFDAGKKVLVTVGLDRQTGKELWRAAAPAGRVERVHRTNSPAAATPASDGRRVVVYFGSYGLICYDLDGKELWKRPVPTPRTTFGTATSPVLAGEVVLLKVQGPGGSLLALDAATGKELWKKEKMPFDPGYSLPLVRPAKGGDEVIVHGDRGIRAYRLKDGKDLWSMVGAISTAVPTPLSSDGLVYFTSQSAGGDADDRLKLPTFKEMLAKYDKDKDGKISREEAKGVVLYRRVEDGGEGDITLGSLFGVADRSGDGKIDSLEWTLGTMMAALYQNALVAARFEDGDQPAPPKVVWREQKALPEVATPLCYQGRLYLAKHDGLVSCLDAKSGKLLDRKRLGATGLYYASPVAGDGKVYLATMRGVMLVLKAGDKLEVLARNDVGEPVAATPALVDGILYLRTEKRLYAFKE